jgi:hypothetical protein
VNRTADFIVAVDNDAKVTRHRLFSAVKQRSVHPSSTGVSEPSRWATPATGHPGSAMRLFYGPTPMSGPDEIRPASAVSVFGKLEGEAMALKATPKG